MVQSSALGFPRVGSFRELKKAVEAYWKGKSSQAELLAVAKDIRNQNWQMQKDAGITQIACGDYTLYDHVLDMIATVGAIPKRYGFSGDNVDLDTYFAMARGRQTDGQDVTAMEMTKWFDTNYHYIVPEFDDVEQFSLTSTKIIDDFIEARDAGFNARPVIIGPVSFLLLGKNRDSGAIDLGLLQSLLPVYKKLISGLREAGAETIQIDEPFLVMDLSAEQKDAIAESYDLLADLNVDIIVATYFGDLRDNLDLALNLPVAGLHVDLVRGANQLDDVLAGISKDKVLSLGLVDGRNIWKNNLDNSIALAEKAANALGKERVIIAPSCSLLHSPVDLDSETALDDEFKGWLSFAKQKLSEIAIIAKAVAEGRDAVASELADNVKAIESRKTSSRIHNDAVKARTAGITADMISRENPYEVRRQAQIASLGLPLFPTTSIGSFPQTKELRQQRAKFKKGELTAEQYEDYLQKLTIQAMQWQDEIGFDMPVHGEFERNDMVEYFGEKMDGYAFTKFGWVQSYGSRCVKPPVIFGDVSRASAMTVKWSAFAQQHTSNPVKGMLTGPVTMLQWAFVRDDQTRETTCKQIALALRDEVTDLEAAGIKAIQIDEPAIREGLPLRNADKTAYLQWAVDSFIISAAGVRDETQIHTHMCYSEFNDIISDVARMDADVISIETSRSAMDLLEAFVEYDYPLEIGPGVYDIHSPRIPNTEEMVYLLEKALKVLKPEQVWVNPDCGLKTRDWSETKPALVKMIEAAKIIREKYSNKAVA